MAQEETTTVTKASPTYCVVPRKISGWVTSLCKQRQPPYSDKKRAASLLRQKERKNPGAMLQHFLPTSKKLSCTLLLFSHHSPLRTVCNSSGMEEHFKNAATVNNLCTRPKHRNKPLIPDTCVHHYQGKVTTCDKESNTHTQAAH